MPEFPIDMVAPDGQPWQVHTQAELAQRAVEGYRLRRAVPGVDLAVAQPPRASAPREVLSRRGETPDEPSPSPAAAPVSDAAPAAAARLRRSSRKATS